MGPRGGNPEHPAPVQQPAQDDEPAPIDDQINN